MIYLELDPKKIRLLELNAQFMNHDTFRQLVENIAHDQDLMHDPFGAYWGYYQEGDEIQYDADNEPIVEVLSGNHRVMAARAAGLPRIKIKVSTAPMSREERIARQLSGNALVGESDKEILRQLYDHLDEASWKQYSGLDDKTLGLLEEVSLPSIGEAGLTFQTITFTFLPHELERVTAVWEEAQALVRADKVFLARWGEYDRLLDGLAQAGAAYGITNTATSLLAILTVFERHLSDLQEGWYNPAMEEVKHKGWVPLASVVGRSDIPAVEAAKLRRAVERLVTEGLVDPKERWRALAILADNAMPKEGAST